MWKIKINLKIEEVSTGLNINDSDMMVSGKKEELGGRTSFMG